MTPEHKIVIGALMAYTGNMWGARGALVRVCYVQRGSALPDNDPDEDRYQGGEKLVRDNETLERLGGVTKDDLVDVVFIRPNGSTSIVHLDAELGELAPCADPSTRPRPDRVRTRRSRTRVSSR